MDIRGRHTKRYTFRSPDVKRLRELASLVKNPLDFAKRYGNLLTLLNTDVDEGLLKTFVQFYDPVFRCFTFPDYQLLPTLEEYAHTLGIVISDRMPFNGLEAIPRSQDISVLLHIRKSEIDKNLRTKKGILGLTSRFLLERAFTFAEAGRRLASENILALLIYGLMLFPNIGNFVDINAMRIFKIKNPVPTLLGDTYFSIHHRHRQGGGEIVCCAPLLHRWIVSHLPKSPIFQRNKKEWQWSRRFMSLTHKDIHWYTLADNDMEIIDSCMGFANVPLMGTQGGINYNPVLAKRQLGYANSEKPIGFTTESYCYCEGADPQGLKDKMIRAWLCIRRMKRGNAKNCVAKENYTAWVKKRAEEFRMPYVLEKPMFPTVKKPTTLGKYKEALIKLKQEKDALKSKFLTTSAENDRLKEQVKDQETTLNFQDEWLIKKDEALKRKRKFDELTKETPALDKWKRIVNKLKTEQVKLKAQHAQEILKLKLQQAFDLSSDEDN